MKWHYIFSILLFLFFNNIKAAHELGIEVSYNHISNKTFQVKIKRYRDCNGQAYTNPNLIVYDVRTKRQIQYSSTLLSIKEITNICPKDSLRCLPLNTTGKGDGIEEHQYYVNLNFDSADLKNLIDSGSCLFQFGVNLCCTQSNISTGSSSNILSYADLNYCNAPHNSSPTLARPIFHQDVNQAFLYNPYAKEINGDSIVYDWELPHESFTKQYTYNTYGNIPLTVYKPGGTNQINPNVNPPIGFYFNRITGDMICSPVVSSEVSLICYKVSEYKYDSNTKSYKYAGCTRRSTIIIIINGANHAPTFDTSTKFSYFVCENENLCFDIKSYDLPFNSNKNDTVKMKWEYNIEGASLKFIDSTGKLPISRFCWKATKNQVHHNPYIIRVSLIDNNCPLLTLSSRTISVFVKSKPNPSFEIKYIECGKYQFKAFDSSTTNQPIVHNWIVKNTRNQNISQKTGFFNNYNSISNKALDTFTFLVNDTFYIVHTVKNAYHCESQSIDTIIVKNAVDFNVNLTDTLYCSGQELNLNPTITLGNGPFQFIWENSNKQLLDTSRAITYLVPNNIKKDSCLEEVLTIQTTFGNQCKLKKKVLIYVKPKPILALSKLKDTLCYLQNFNISGYSFTNRFFNPINNDEVLASNSRLNKHSIFWIINNDSILSDTILHTKIPKQYKVFSIDNISTCKSDTSIIELSHLPKIDVNIKGDSVFCYNSPITLKAMGKHLNYEYEWKDNDNNTISTNDIMNDIADISKYYSIISSLKIGNHTCYDTILYNIKTNTLVKTSQFNSLRICKNINFILKEIDYNSSGKTAFYEWTKLNNSEKFNGHILKDSVTKNETYQLVLGILENGILCKDSTLIQILTYPDAKKPIITELSKGKLISSYLINNQWFINGQKLIGDTNRILDFTKNGYYQVAYYDLNGCLSLLSDSFIGNVSTKHLAWKSNFQIFPNPSISGLNIFALQNCYYDVMVSDYQGKLIYESKQNFSKCIVPQFATGLYFIEIKTEKDNYRIPIIMK